MCKKEIISKKDELEMVTKASWDLGSTVMMRPHYTMLRTLTNPFPLIIRQQQQRTIHATCQRSSNLTNIINDVPYSSLRVHTITSAGHIELSSGMVLTGPCLFLGGKVFLWDVPPVKLWDGWNKEMFQIFDVVVPKPQILLFGTGSRTVQLPSSLRTHLFQNGIQCDMMDTRNACSTYNLLTEEGRNVAAALLPLSQTGWEKTSIP
ncbi:hypothetical protein Clacol_001354 [Clathrus columnatus]|uniref:NADH dehydrogenase [ubiquinone] 1 alpha subcomplex assembly factor 3 n=1 Tax=Clathrus columnatus TaxID=1419009 RepID=A0AAV4ZY38_9AGAM|nr:hypothetical protein Clacol_001354 [Clathrus columnatus]